MYLDFFGLNVYPFRLTPDSDFLFMSRGHARAKAYMDYGVVSRDGFVVITGDVGSGKTTLLNKLVSELPEDVVAAVIAQPQLDDFEFLQAVMAELGFSRIEAGRVELVNRLREFLVDQHREGRHVLLVVDEAQSLGYRVLEQIRFLSGLEANRDKLMSVIMAGQPELSRVLESGDMAQLLQRVRLRFHLEALSSEETREYIEHRLAVAGYTGGQLFEEDALATIDEYTGGIPRLINSLCDMALLTGYVEGRHTIDKGLVQSAVSELAWTPFHERAKHPDGKAWGAHAATASEIALSDADRQMFRELNNNLHRLVELMVDSSRHVRDELDAIQHRLSVIEGKQTAPEATNSSRRRS